jgi:hypothetical protein
MLKLVCESHLRSLRVFKLVDNAGRRGDKITKIRVVRIIEIQKKRFRIQYKNQNARTSTN